MEGRAGFADAEGMGVSGRLEEHPFVRQGPAAQLVDGDRDGIELLAVQGEVDIDPAIPQGTLEWAELMIEITVPVQRANDLFERDIVCSTESSIAVFL